VNDLREAAPFPCGTIVLLATRSGQILNRTDLAAPLGVSVPTISGWLNILKASGQVVLVPPFFENYCKRLTKSPKVYFIDPDLLCFLLGIESETMLNRSPFLGAFFETLGTLEIIKTQINTGSLRALYYFRDQQGLEVDFIVHRGDRRLFLIEAGSPERSPPDGRSTGSTYKSHFGLRRRLRRRSPRAGDYRRGQGASTRGHVIAAGRPVEATRAALRRFADRRPLDHTPWSFHNATKWPPPRMFLPFRKGSM
jgi:hypothetical protein